MTLNGVMALFCVISADSGSFRVHCVKVYVRYLISWWVLVKFCRLPWRSASRGFVSDSNTCFKTACR